MQDPIKNPVKVCFFSINGKMTEKWTEKWTEIDKMGKRAFSFPRALSNDRARAPAIKNQQK
jgi:hypothetical protein